MQTLHKWKQRLKGLPLGQEDNTPVAIYAGNRPLQRELDRGGAAEEDDIDELCAALNMSCWLPCVDVCPARLWAKSTPSARVIWARSRMVAQSPDAQQTVRM